MSLNYFLFSLFYLKRQRKISQKFDRKKKQFHLILLIRLAVILIIITYFPWPRCFSINGHYEFYMVKTGRINRGRIQSTNLRHRHSYETPEALERSSYSVHKDHGTLTISIVIEVGCYQYFNTNFPFNCILSKSITACRFNSPMTLSLGLQLI